MVADPHVLRPDHLPTPFTAAEIREGCPPGRTVRSLVIEAGAEPIVRVTRFLSCDADGADRESWAEAPDGRRLTEPVSDHATWREFQEHASMPADSTRIDKETIDIPAGRYDCLRYTRVDGDTVDTFWFATSAPGMPLRFEERVKGELVYSSTAIADVRA
ncbi:MAG TPA: hypothetical protein VE011_12635 [Candidatus Dormibacteraeota bacterium]|nr:hypothetical protein [Candidatus Dormibacteraeota bacterium]